MSTETDGIRQILRALAEARDGPFYSLWLYLLERFDHLGPEVRTWLQRRPDIGFRIYQVADSDEAYLVVGASAIRKDGREITWGVSLTTREGDLLVEGTVEYGDDDGYHPLFSREAATEDPVEAAALIGDYAKQLCEQKRWYEDPIETGAAAREGPEQ